MNCSEMSEEIALLASGDLTDREARLVRDHIAACPSCRAEYEDMLRISRELSGGESAALTEIERLRLENRALRALSGSRAVHLGPIRVAPPLTALLRVAAAVILVGAGYVAAPYLNRAILPGGAAGSSAATDLRPEQQFDGSLGSHRLSARGLSLIARGRAAQDDPGL